MKSKKRLVGKKGKSRRLVTKPIKFLAKKILSKKSVAKKPVLKVKPIKKNLKRKVIVKNKIQKSEKKQNRDSFVAESFFKAKIKVIGIGGGGGSIVSEIGRSLHKATFVVADTDVRAFKKRAGIKYFLFGQELTHGLGTGVNPDLGQRAAEQEIEKITKFFNDQDIVIFIASLGGGLGSGATKVFAKATENFNGITLGIFTLPFKFEGAKKYNIALRSLRELRKLLNVSITIPNERIFKIIDENTAITQAFSIVNKSLIESLESLIDLIYSPGIINIDFADLRAILQGKGNLAFLNTAEASGSNRAQIIAEKILHNPLYQQNSFIAQKILFNISGGASLGMMEVDSISKSISEKNPKAKIIFGISKNPKLKNKIKTTLLMTGENSDAISVVEKIKSKIGKVKKERVEIISKVVTKISKKSLKKQDKGVAGLASLQPIFDDSLLSDLVEKKKQVAGSAYGDISLRLPLIDEAEIKNQLTEKNNRLNIVESLPKRKKAIRRSGLDIKKAEELEESKQSLQEKEWEIPAFLRLKK